MLSLLKMDLRQLFHRKTLYVMIAALSAMTLYMLFLSDPSTLTMGNVLGVLDGISMDNFMSAGSGLGFLFACLLGTGGIVMGVVWGLSAIHFPYADQILNWTMYGASTIPGLNTGIMDLIHVILVTAIWVAVYGLLSAELLRKKDIQVPADDNNISLLYNCNRKKVVLWQRKSAYL